MKEIDARLQAALRQSAIVPWFSIQLSAMPPFIIGMDRLLGWRVHEHGRLGRIDLEVDFDNTDGYFALFGGPYFMGRGFYSYEGAIVDGEILSAQTRLWYLSEVKSIGVAGGAERLRLVATNQATALQQLRATSRTFTGETLMTIATDVFNQAGLTLHVDASKMWSYPIARFTAPRGFSHAFTLGQLLGDGVQTLARGYGHITGEFPDVWMEGLTLSPAVDFTLNGATDAEIRSMTRHARQRPSRVSINGVVAYATEAIDKPPYSSAYPRLEALVLPTLGNGGPLNALTDRVTAELLDNVETADQVEVVCSPEWRVELWNVVGLLNVGGFLPDVVEGAPWRVAEIWHDYHPGSMSTRLRLRRCCADLQLVNISPAAAAERIVLDTGTHGAAQSDTDALTFDGQTMTIDPPAPAAPLALGALAKGQWVDGLNVDQLDGRHARELISELVVVIEGGVTEWVLDEHGDVIMATKGY